MFKVEVKTKRQYSGEPQGQIDSSSAAPRLQDGLGVGRGAKDVTAHALSKSLNSAFWQLKHGVWNLLVIWGFTLWFSRGGVWPGREDEKGRGGSSEIPFLFCICIYILLDIVPLWALLAFSLKFTWQLTFTPQHLIEESICFSFTHLRSTHLLFLFPSILPKIQPLSFSDSYFFFKFILYLSPYETGLSLFVPYSSVPQFSFSPKSNEGA